MSKCSNCGAELDAGAKFCMECGTPVPQVKKCVQCGMELPLKAKFCFGCGAPQEGGPTGAGINMGDKNVIAGDVIGQKVVGDNVQSKIMGNVINNTFQDETKKIINCHICGKHLTSDNGHTCPSCGNVVCDEHFDALKNLCLKCAEIKKQDALKQYEAKLGPICADGRIDIIERNTLDKLAQILGLSKEETLPLEQKCLLQAKASTITRTEQLTLDSVKKAFFTDEFDAAFVDIKKLYERYPSNDEVVNWYLRFARVVSPDETINDIAKLQGDFCEGYLSLVCIYMAKNQMPEAEVALNKAKQMNPDSVLVKCADALFLMKLFKTTNNPGFLKEAEYALQNASTNDEYEEFLLKNTRVVLDVLQKKQNNLQDYEPKFLEKFFNLGVVIAKDCEHLRNLIKIAVEKNGPNCDLNFIDVSKVTNMFVGEFESIFEDTEFNGDISQWDVSNVTDMSFMFFCSKFNGDIGQWNVSNVTDMRDMFEASQFNGDISQWDVSKVTDMRCMFRETQFNGDISQWNVSNVTNMRIMFNQSQFNGDISKWDVSNVTDMRMMFHNSQYNGDISKWNVSNVKDMDYMFYQSQFNGDISKWNVSNVKTMSHMFSYSKFNGDISKWEINYDVVTKQVDEIFDESTLKANGKIPAWIERCLQIKKTKEIVVGLKQPVKSIKKALEIAEDGWKIFVEPGVYPESFIIDKELSITGIINDGQKPIVQLDANQCIEIRSNVILKNFEVTSKINSELSNDSSLAVIRVIKFATLENIVVKNSAGCGILIEDESNPFERINEQINNLLNSVIGGDVSNNAHSIISQCEIKKCNGNGIVISGTGCYLKNCNVHDNMGHGVLIRNNATPKLEFCKIHDNKDGKSQGIGIVAVGESKPEIVSCEVFNNSIVGIAEQGRACGTYSNCFIHDNYGNGVNVGGTTTGTFENCYIYNNKTSGFVIKGESSPKIENCIVYNNRVDGEKYSGFVIREQAKPTITGCEIYGHLGDGIYEKEQAQGAYSNCNIHDNAGEQIRREH